MDLTSCSWFEKAAVYCATRLFRILRKCDKLKVVYLDLSQELNVSMNVFKFWKKMKEITDCFRLRPTEIRMSGIDVKAVVPHDPIGARDNVPLRFVSAKFAYFKGRFQYS